VWWFSLGPIFFVTYCLPLREGGRGGLRSFTHLPARTHARTHARTQSSLTLSALGQPSPQVSYTSVSSVVYLDELTHLVRRRLSVYSLPRPSPASVNPYQSPHILTPFRPTYKGQPNPNPPPFSPPSSKTALSPEYLFVLHNSATSSTPLPPPPPLLSPDFVSSPSPYRHI
jgi:hypothetical protein